MIKKILTSVLTLCSITLIAQDNVRYVSSNGLNMRASHNATSKVLLTLKKCDEVQLLGWEGERTIVNGNVGHWVQVRVKNKIGYVFDTHLSELMHPDCLFGETKPTKKETIVLKPLKQWKYMVAQSGSAEFLAKPNEYAETLAFIGYGQKVEFLGYTIASNGDSRYMKVRYKGVLGYVLENGFDDLPPSD